MEKACGKEGHLPRAETFSGGQPEATCKGTWGINTIITYSLPNPSSYLPSWEVSQKPEAREVSGCGPPTSQPLGTQQGRERWKADPPGPSGSITAPGVHGSVVTTVQSLPRRLTQQLMNDKHMGSRVWGPGVWRPQGLSIKYKIEE